MAQHLPTTATAAGLIWSLCQRLEFFAEHQPVALTQLTFGRLTSTFKVETNRGCYAVRYYDDAVQARHRQQELRCQHAAAAAGLAPAPLCLNNHQRMLVSEFLPEAVPMQQALLQPQSPLLLALLVRLHQLPVQTAVLDPWLYLQQLRQKVETAWSEQDEMLFQRLLDLARQLQFFPAQIGLCHMDLNPANLLWSANRLWLIDFEYCQLADVAFDLASLSWCFALSAGDELVLVQSYLSARGLLLDAVWQQKYQLVKRLTLGFAWLWYQQEQQWNQDPRHFNAATVTRQQLLQLLPL